MLNAEILAAAQRLLDQGEDRSALAEELGVTRDTLRKAIADGRLHKAPEPVAASKSARSVRDADAAERMGTACARIGERV